MLIAAGAAPCALAQGSSGELASPATVTPGRKLPFAWIVPSRGARSYPRAASALLALLTSGAAYAPKAPPARPDIARPLPLGAVRLTGGPLKRAQDLDAQYLLSLAPTA